MVEVHHLSNSRSQRVLWMLEEIGLEYRIVRYERDPKRRRCSNVSMGSSACTLRMSKKRSALRIS